MSYLLQLPPEVREKIFNNCHASDLKSLACCSSAYSTKLKPILWCTIHIGCEYLLKLDWTNPDDEKKLENLQYTRTLRFFPQTIKDLDSESDFSDGDDDCIKDIEKKLHANIKKIIKSCERLNIFYIDRYMAYLHHDSYINGECLQFICKTLSSLKSLSITSFGIPIFVQKAITKHYTDLSTLSALNLLGTQCSNLTIPVNVCEAISKITDLSELNLQSCNISDTDLAILCKNLIKLKMLNVACTSVSDEGISHLVKLIRLEVLNIRKCKGITNRGLSCVCDLVTLQYLDISACHKITNKGLAHLSTLTSLKKLYMNSIFNMSDSCVPIISALTSLQHLGLMESNITDDSLECLLSKKKSLLELYIGSNFITDVGMSHISTLTSLRKLDISNFDLEDSGLYIIRNMFYLQYLSIGYTNVTDTGFKHLSTFRSLETLICDGVDVTDDGVLYICSMEKLRKLEMCFCSQITDISMSHLSTMLHLEHINVADANITDVGLKYLTSLRSLRTLICDDTMAMDIADSFSCQVELVMV